MSGRTTVVALAVVFASGLGVTAALTTRASAQTNTTPVRGMMSVFGPFHLTPGELSSTGGGGAGSQALIGLLLPAVQKASTPFRVQILNGDTNLLLPAVMPSSSMTINWGDTLVLTLTANNIRNGFQLNVFDEMTSKAITTKLTNFQDFSVRLLPAVQSTGAPAQPVACSMTLMGATNATFADGSVEPIPFQYALPAVQMPAPAQ